MKVIKEFAPLTVKFETAEEVDFIREVLDKAYSHENSKWLAPMRTGTTKLQERIYIFKKDLGI